MQTGETRTIRIEKEIGVASIEDFLAKNKSKMGD